MTYSIALSPEELHMLIKAMEAKLLDLIDTGDTSEMKRVLYRIDELKAAK